MKALSIIQPWAWLIAMGHKDIENRTWPTNVRGVFAIHASKGFDQQALVRLRLNAEEYGLGPISFPQVFDRGSIVGIGEIIGCMEESDSPWFCGPFGYHIIGAKPLVLPIPIKGSLGFWTVPSEIEKEIIHQIS